SAMPASVASGFIGNGTRAFPRLITRESPMTDLTLDDHAYWKGQMRARCAEEGHRTPAWTPPGEPARCRWCGEAIPAPVLCADCPPPDYPTDETRCAPCPRRSVVETPVTNGIS